MEYRLNKNTLNSLYFFFFLELLARLIFNRHAERRIVQHEALCFYTFTLITSKSLFIYLFFIQNRNFIFA